MSVHTTILNEDVFISFMTRKPDGAWLKVKVRCESKEALWKNLHKIEEIGAEQVLEDSMRSEHIPFDSEPTEIDCEQYIEDFLAKGGKITKVSPNFSPTKIDVENLLRELDDLAA